MSLSEAVIEMELGTKLRISYGKKSRLTRLDAPADSYAQEVN
jgi:hypothetical protein